MEKIAIGILGATGVVGQQYAVLLENHPWFQLTYVASSEQSAGKTYAEAVAKKWRCEKPLPTQFSSLIVHSLEDLTAAKKHCNVLFSALPTPQAQLYEEHYAQGGCAIISNASFHRTTPDVPVLIPEINAAHLGILKKQQAQRGWQKGFIVTKPNCSIQSFMIPLDPLHQRFKISQLSITTLQAISGAGYPGVSSHDMIDNIIPYIEHEEEKSETEPLKIWGRMLDSYITPEIGVKISAQCTRVPILHGHTACVAVKFLQPPSQEEILAIWRNYQSPLSELQLPSAPLQVIRYLQDLDRPQPRQDRDYANGMGICIGRLRPCPLLDFRFVGLSHNTIRGAAGGGILIAELLFAKNLL